MSLYKVIIACAIVLSAIACLWCMGAIYCWEREKLVDQITDLKHEVEQRVQRQLTTLDSKSTSYNVSRVLEALRTRSSSDLTNDHERMTFIMNSPSYDMVRKLERQLVEIDSSVVGQCVNAIMPVK